jgi:2-aminoadipate transaminase
MAQAIDQYFPKEYIRTNPTGGMFFWIVGPQHIDFTVLLQKAQSEQKVAYVPGEAFHFQEGKGKNTMRLNFGYNTPEVIKQAIQKLGQILPLVIATSHNT